MEPTNVIPLNDSGKEDPKSAREDPKSAREDPKEQMASEIMHILANLLRQIMKLALYDKLPSKETILDYVKKIDKKKIKVPNTLVRLFKVLDPYGEELFALTDEFMVKGSAVELLPGINFTKIYVDVDLDVASKKTMLKYLSVIKCYTNLYFDKHVEQTKGVIEKLLVGFNPSEKEKSKEEIREAKETIKKMFGNTGTSENTRNAMDDLVDQISDKLCETGIDSESTDMSGLLNTALGIAEKNKQSLFQKNIDFSEVTKTASSVMGSIYSDPKMSGDMKKQMGFDPAEFLNSMMPQQEQQGPPPDIGKILRQTMEKLDPAQKKEFDKIMKQMQQGQQPKKVFRGRK